MMADGGFFPQGVKVVVVRVVLAEMADTSAVLLLLPGGPSLVAALAARRRRLDGFLVQRRPAGLTNLPNFTYWKLMMKGTLMNMDDDTKERGGLLHKTSKWLRIQNMHMKRIKKTPEKPRISREKFRQKIMQMN